MKDVLGRDSVRSRTADGTVRCAIYTRKSTDEGLDQDFNSLDAQRQAAEAYVESQRHEGWVCLPDRYDDGGYSGGNMDRPALQRLFADIEDSKVDCLLSYKVDRISRSLMDFSKIMDILEKNDVSFVSVTQQFNSATSMGRLTLNILLSFAQFERETIAERTRDKMGASRKLGKWMGGRWILGYDVDSARRRLVVNEVEAARVRDIFELYLEKRSLIPTVRELNHRNWNTKSWTTKKGKEYGGQPFNKNSLFGVLTNVVYLGKVCYEGEIYEGEQEVIVPPSLWRRVQDLLKHNGRTGGDGVRNKYGALLRGLLVCASCGTSMTHHYTAKGKVLYRYYVCARAQKQGWDSCPTKSVSAPDIEKFVIDRIRCIGRDDALLTETLGRARAQGEERIARLKNEQGKLQRQMSRDSLEISQAMDRVARGGQDERDAMSRLALLQDRMASAEKRSTNIREEMITVGRDLVDERDVVGALSLFDPAWEGLSHHEQARIVHLLVERVAYDGVNGKISWTFRPSGIKALCEEYGN